MLKLFKLVVCPTLILYGLCFNRRSQRWVHPGLGPYRQWGYPGCQPMPFPGIVPRCPCSFAIVSAKRSPRRHSRHEHTWWVCPLAGKDASPGTETRNYRWSKTWTLQRYTHVGGFEESLNGSNCSALANPPNTSACGISWSPGCFGGHPGCHWTSSGVGPRGPSRSPGRTSWGADCGWFRWLGSPRYLSNGRPERCRNMQWKHPVKFCGWVCGHTWQSLIVRAFPFKTKFLLNKTKSASWNWGRHYADEFDGVEAREKARNLQKHAMQICGRAWRWPLIVFASGISQTSVFCALANAESMERILKL